MSDTGTNTVGPSENPPPLIPSTGGYTLQPGTQLQARKTVDVAPGVAQPKETEYTPAGYVGQNLVDSKGVISRGQYSTDEAFNEIAKLGTAGERRAFLNILSAAGVYGNSKPSSTGTSSADIAAMKEALLYANARGVTVDVAARLMMTDPGVQEWRKSTSGAGGTRIRTTPKEDLRAVFKQATSSVLGRQLSDAELDKFVKSYNAAEVREGMGGAAAPNVQVAAETAATAAAPEEANAMGMLQLANLMDQSLKGLG